MTIQFLGSFVEAMGNRLFRFIVFTNYLHCYLGLMKNTLAIVHEKRETSLLYFISDTVKILCLLSAFQWRIMI